MPNLDDPITAKINALVEAERSTPRRWSGSREYCQGASTGYEVGLSDAMRVATLRGATDAELVAELYARLVEADRG